MFALICSLSRASNTNISDLDSRFAEHVYPKLAQNSPSFIVPALDRYLFPQKKKKRVAAVSTSKVASNNPKHTISTAGWSRAMHASMVSVDQFSQQTPNWICQHFLVKIQQFFQPHPSWVSNFYTKSIHHLVYPLHPTTTSPPKKNGPAQPFKNSTPNFLCTQGARFRLAKMWSLNLVRSFRFSCSMSNTRKFHNESCCLNVVLGWEFSWDQKIRATEALLDYIASVLYILEEATTGGFGHRCFFDTCKPANFRYTHVWTSTHF